MRSRVAIETDGGRGVSLPTIRGQTDGRIVSERGGEVSCAVGPTLLLGLHHEQQHQELIVTDVKHARAANPLHPVYREANCNDGDAVPNRAWVSFAGGLVKIGHDGSDFAFDNEFPRHCVFLREFGLANRLVTKGEYLAFLADGGLDHPKFWLFDGWAARKVGDGQLNSTG
jgi:formylglycine-generating enzyme required for sulfatase activity